MSDQIGIRLSGSGGQGMILAGVILGEASILEGKNVIQTQSYGPEARGGASKSELVISNEEIDYPKPRKIDILLALTQEAYSKYSIDVKPGGLIISDSDWVTNESHIESIDVPIIKTASNEFKPMVANIISLGILVKATGILKEESIIQAVLAKVPKGTEELNTNALKRGFEFAEQYLNRKKQ
jgi:2-oxoglutarate ferredoxin oxidoreductase subunit gamma